MNIWLLVTFSQVVAYETLFSICRSTIKVGLGAKVSKLIDEDGHGDDGHGDITINGRLTRQLVENKTFWLILCCMNLLYMFRQLIDIIILMSGNILFF